MTSTLSSRTMTVVNESSDEEEKAVQEAAVSNEEKDAASDSEAERFVPPIDPLESDSDDDHDEPSLCVHGL